jgi:hypothetical protein
VKPIFSIYSIYDESKKSNFPILASRMLSCRYILFIFWFAHTYWHKFVFYISLLWTPFERSIEFIVFFNLPSENFPACKNMKNIFIFIVFCSFDVVLASRMACLSSNKKRNGIVNNNKINFFHFWQWRDFDLLSNKKLELIFERAGVVDGVIFDRKTIKYYLS